jgi:hypothetical protein
LPLLLGGGGYAGHRGGGTNIPGAPQIALSGLMVAFLNVGCRSLRPQPSPVPRTAMFGFPDPCMIMFRIIGRTPGGRGRLAQGHALRYALSAACCFSLPIAPRGARYDSPARYVAANDFWVPHRANARAGGPRLPRWDSSLLRGIPGFPGRAALLELLSRFIRLFAVVKRVFCRCTESR